MKLHRNIKHNEKVCRTQELDYHIQGQGHNKGSEVKACVCDYLKPAEANFVKLHRKVFKLKVCHTLYLCSQTQGKGHNLGSEFKIPLSNYSEKVPKQTSLNFTER